MHQSYVAKSIEDTIYLAQSLGSKLKGGEIINLLGDIGTGKTTFTKALVEGAGFMDHVSSPTFTICNKYSDRSDNNESNVKVIYHCDFYRLENDKLIQRELEDMLASDAVVVMEWAENIPVFSELQLVNIAISVDASDYREIEINTPNDQAYLKVDPQ